MTGGRIMNNITTEIKCPYCKTNFEVDVDLEDTDVSEFQDGEEFDIEFDEMQCPNCENFFSMEGAVTKNGNKLELEIKSID
jgi:phage FluMu protein Com